MDEWQNRIKNECVREKVEVVSIVEKMVESCLRLFGQPNDNG